jgi:outer membrane protein assembly factor BamD
MKHILYIITIAIGFSSCSEYQKVFRKDDIAPKYALGEKLYNEGKYKKAQNLFAQIAPNYRSGKAGAEKLMYMYGNTFYLQEDWNGAAYQIERFTKAYSRSEKLEEMAFKAAKSNYYLSPRSSLDQEDTEKALLKLQNFMNTYPKSEYLKEASDLSLELNAKLEEKAYNIAKGYHNRISTGTQYGDDYQAAITVFDNFLNAYPGTEFKEKALYYKYDTAYLLAKNSTERKKKARLEKAIVYYNKWHKTASDSDLINDAEQSLAAINKQLEQFNK